MIMSFSVASKQVANLLIVGQLSQYVNEELRQYYKKQMYIHGLVQDCIISIANALQILQSCT